MFILSSLENITPTRTLNLAYIILDCIFLAVLVALFIIKKRYITLFWSLFGGILYFIVDYGFFHLVGHTRTVTYNGNSSETITALVLLWMSLSYGITNFAFIWLCLKKDKYLKEWLILIIGWWLIAPTLSQMGGDSATIVTSRTTGSYHWIMALLLVIGYLMLIIYNMVTKTKMVNILWLILIGVSVQFAWEFSLLINGIRPMNEDSIMTIIINSLIETNMGMPYIYLIYLFVGKKYNDDLTRRVPTKEENELEVVNN